MRRGVPARCIANPAQYVTHPLKVFELDFEPYRRRAALREVQQRLFPSTSEIYGCPRTACWTKRRARRLRSRQQQRWIYAASKQLLDSCHSRLTACVTTSINSVQAVQFHRPQPRQRRGAEEGSSRVFTQFLSNVLFNDPSNSSMVAGRSFLYVHRRCRRGVADDTREQGMGVQAGASSTSE